MAIITISRGTFAGGEKLAKLLADRLGYRVVSRELLYEDVGKRWGIAGERINDLLEEAPSYRSLEMAQRDTRQSLAERRRLLFVALQASLCELLKEDDAIYHGYAGHLLLPGVSHVLRARIVAPRPQRVQMAMDREGLTRNEASRKIDQVDHERSRWTQAFFGVRWDDPLLFDLVLNLEQMSLEEAADIAVHTAKLPRFQATEESRARIADLSLAGHVAATLLGTPTLGKLPLEIQAEHGVVKVLGVGPTAADEAVKLARQVAGVKLVVVGS